VEVLREVEVEALCPMPHSTTHFGGINDFFGQSVGRGVSKSKFGDLGVKALAQHGTILLGLDRPVKRCET